MDTQNPNVPSRAHPRVAGKKHPNRPPHAAGLTHDNARHTTRFTVIGNHLAQHPELSLLAIGLSVHIQSLPAGSRIDIKSLAARFPEGTARIAAALRELEAHGYLRRTRERVPDGRIITRPTSCNQPGHSSTGTPRPAPRKRTRQPGGKPLPAVPRPAYPAPPFSSGPRTSSPASAARTPASSSPAATPPTSPRGSPPGSNETSRRPPYGTP